MAINDIASTKHSDAYALAELFIKVPLGAGFGYAAHQDSSNRGVFVFLGVLHASLAMHGIHTLAANRPDRADPQVRTRAGAVVRIGPVRGVITPTVSEDGPGIGLAGTF